ncbi:GrpB family protein [Agrobacterium larrymoorei]|uniref:GrpB family protein n=1 Tax=Agrobacterium larrymoorei TaxID=160699 RepID=UPI003CC90F22
MPGLAAKPYIDIDVVQKASMGMEAGRVRREAAGFEPRGSRHGDGVFASMVRDPLPGLHVYLCPPDSLTHQNRMRFRDILRQNPSLANQYATLKMALPSNMRTMGMPTPSPSPTSSPRR